MSPAPTFLSGRPALLVAGAGALCVGLAAFVFLPGGGPPLAWSSATATEVPYAPAVGDGLLAFCTQDETVHVVDLATGRELWSRSDRRSFSTPCVAAGRVLVPALDGALTAFDARTGEDAWTAFGLGFIEAVVPAGDEVLVGRGAGFLALDPETGADLWSHEKQDEDGRWCSTEAIAVAEGVAYVAYSVEEAFQVSIGGRTMVDGGVYAVDLEDGRELWTAPIEHRVRRAPQVAGDAVVCATVSGFSDAVYALERRDGSIRWKHEGVNGSPRVCGDTVCFEGVDAELTHDRDVPLLRESYAFTGVDLANGEQEWRRGFSGDGIESLAVGELALFSRGDHVDALHAGSGRLAWRLPLEAPASAPLAAGDGLLVVLTEDHRVAAYRLE